MASTLLKNKRGEKKTMVHSERGSGAGAHTLAPGKCIAIFLWGVFIVLCFIHRDEITVERIVNYAPSDPVAAAVIMLLLFALKSVTLVVYGGILYAADGIMFSLPVAIALNLIGTVIMTTTPFFIGRHLGRGAVEKLTARNKYMKLLRDFSGKNELPISFFVRIVGLLPSDLVSMYLGAIEVRYDRYIAGTILGLLPAVLNFSIMGMSIHDMSSPVFITSVCCEIGLMFLSVLIFIMWKRKKNAESEEDEH